MATQQSTQYNSIVDEYSALYNAASANYPAAALEEAQFKNAILPSSSSKQSSQSRPDIRGKHVLDLATGTGHYARRYLEWGAASVHAIDISSGMIDEARAESARRNIPESLLRYYVGDVTDPTLSISCPHTSDNKFDLVLSGWLLNYAPDTTAMSAMFATIARHLTPGGWTANMTSPLLTYVSGIATTDAETFKAETTLLSAALKPPHGALAKYGCYGRVLGQVKDGLKVKLTLAMLDKSVDDPGFASFENYYLRPSVHDEALKHAGMFEDDRLEWLPVVLPEQLIEDMAALGRPRSFFNEWVYYPICRVGVARKRRSGS